MIGRIPRCALYMALVFCLAETIGTAQSADALPFAKSYTVTGDYVVGGVDLPPGGTSGFATATIPMSGVPANADILAAFLYWETISGGPQQVDGVRFRGEPVTVVKATSTPLAASYAPCWTSGGSQGGYTLSGFRADVLRMLPPQLDA